MQTSNGKYTPYLLSVALIQPDPDQPRKHFDEKELLALGRNMKDRGGNLKPILVRRVGDGYVLVEGERRWRAAQRVGIDKLSAVVLEGDLPPEEVRIVQLSLEAHHAPLTPIERAKLYDRVMRDHAWDQRQLCDKLGLNPATVCRTLSYLKLEDEYHVHIGEAIPERAAYRLSQLEEAERREWATLFLAGRGKVDALERYLKARKGATATAAPEKGAAALKDFKKIVDLVAVRCQDADAGLEQVIAAARRAIKLRARDYAWRTVFDTLRDEFQGGTR